MEKIILILSILLSCYFVDAQIKVKCDIEIGYLNENISLNFVKAYPLDGFELQYNSGHVSYCDLVGEFSFKNIHLEQQIYNVFGHKNGYTFAALEILYKTRLYYKYKAFSGGFEHMCLHPIINQHNEISSITRRGSYDKIFIRFTFSNE